MIALGTTMERMPFFKLALTFSCSILTGNLKPRLKDPERRSETQYLGCSTGASGVDVSGSATVLVSATFSEVLVTVSVSDSPGLLINSPSSSSSTEGAWYEAVSDGFSSVTVSVVAGADAGVGVLLSTRDSE